MAHKETGRKKPTRKTRTSNTPAKAAGPATAAAKKRAKGSTSKPARDRQAQDAEKPAAHAAKGGEQGATPKAHRARPSSLLDTRIVYCGDCLEQLRKLPDGCVDLVYIDPPFNSNRNYEVFWGETKEKRAFEDRHALRALNKIVEQRYANRETATIRDNPLDGHWDILSGGSIDRGAQRPCLSLI